MLKNILSESIKLHTKLKNKDKVTNLISEFTKTINLLNPN